MQISSKLIKHAQPEVSTLDEIRSQLSLSDKHIISFMVFETTIGNKVVYCCLAGGVMENGEPKLTLTGQACVESLINLPQTDSSPVMIFPLAISETPLIRKITAAFECSIDGSKLCFLVDDQSELDGLVIQALNVSNVGEPTVH